MTAARDHAHEAGGHASAAASTCSSAVQAPMSAIEGSVKRAIMSPDSWVLSACRCNAGPGQHAGAFCHCSHCHILLFHDKKSSGNSGAWGLASAAVDASMLECFATALTAHILLVWHTNSS